MDINNINPKIDYSNQNAVPKYQEHFDKWRRESEETRSSLKCYIDVPYGVGWRQTCDILPAISDDAPVFVFVHGGWWHFLDKSDHTFLARPFVNKGAVFIALNYPLAPMAEIGEIVESIRGGISWVHQNIDRFGGDPDRIVVGGHSAGGHLAAMAVQSDSRRERSVHKLIKACVSVSGLFDLVALLDTPHNESIRMLRSTANILGALSNVATIECPILMAVGSEETKGFQYQHEVFKSACNAAGRDLRDLRVPNANHFTIIEEMAIEDGEFFAEIWQLVCGTAGSSARKCTRCANVGTGHRAT